MSPPIRPWLLMLALGSLLRAAPPPPEAAPPASQPAAPTTRPAALPPAMWDELRALDARLATTADLTADFRQQKFTPLLKKPLASTGTVRVRGASIRWDTAQPRPSVILIRGREIQFHYPQQGELEIYAIDQRLAQLAASPLMRLGPLLEHFELAPLPVTALDENATDQAALALRLTPRAAQLRERLAEVRVLLERGTGQLTLVEIRDPDGDRTVIRFAHVRINQGLTDADLDLKVPPGTRVSRPLEGLSAPPATTAPAPADDRRPAP